MHLVYLVEIVKLIVTLATECRYEFMNFVDDIRGFFMPVEVKKDPGLFPKFFNFVDKIHGYFVPVKKQPVPTISSYFYDSMDYSLRWAEWMVTTKTGLCVTAGLSLYFVYRKNRTEKCVVAGSLVAYAMKDSELMQASFRYIDHLIATESLLSIGAGICAAAGLTLYFLKRQNRSEKTFVGGCILAFAMRNTSMMQGPIRYVDSLLPLTGFEFSVITGLTLYFLYRNNTWEKFCIAGCLVIYGFRDTPPIQYVTSMLFSKPGMFVVAAAGVAYLIFRKKKMTPNYIYPLDAFDEYTPYSYGDIYYREEFVVSHQPVFEDFYGSDLYQEIIHIPRLATPPPFPSTVTYSSPNQDLFNYPVNRADVTHYDSKPKKKKESKKKKGEFLEIPPFAGASYSPKQLPSGSKISGIEETRIGNVRGPSNIDDSNCQCNTTKRKKGKGNRVTWPAQPSIQLSSVSNPAESNENQVKTNAECLLKQQIQQLLLKNTSNASVPSNSEGKQGGLNVSSGQQQQSNQPNIQKQSNVQKQQNNQLDKSVNVAGPSNSRGMQNSRNPFPVPKQQTYQTGFQNPQSEQNNPLLESSLPEPSNSLGNQHSNKPSNVSLRRANIQRPSTNATPDEKFLVRVKLD